MSLIVKIGKKGKQLVKKLLPEEKPHLSYTRRIERVKTGKRICAMTFDDGPMDMPGSPDRFEGRPLTDVLLDILAELIPITSPFILTRAPPLLPGLMAASVWM